MAGPDPGPVDRVAACTGELPCPLLPVRTARLVLRPHAERDAAALAYYRDADVTRYLLLHADDEAGVLELVRRRATSTCPQQAGDALSLVVEHDGVVVGDVMLKLVDERHGVGEVGWALDPRHQGRGFATEAAAAMVALGFDHYGMHRVSAQMDARNDASARVCARLGMRQEAHLRQDWWNHGEWTDTAVWAVLVDEWRAHGGRADVVPDADVVRDEGSGPQDA